MFHLMLQRIVEHLELRYLPHAFQLVLILSYWQYSHNRSQQLLVLRLKVLEYLQTRIKTLNPIFFIPFIAAPILNVWIFKAFVDFLGMNSFQYILPWTTPAPLGIVLGCGITILSSVNSIYFLPSQAADLIPKRSVSFFKSS